MLHYSDVILTKNISITLVHCRFSDPFKGTLRFKESVLINHKERDDLILNVDSTYSKLQHKDTILVFFQGKLLLTVGKTGNRVRYSVNKEFKNAPVTLAEHPAGETSFNFKMRIPHCLADQYGGFTLTMYHKGSELDQRSIHMGMCIVYLLVYRPGYFTVHPPPGSKWTKIF